MNTYIFRDSRRQKLIDALADLGPPGFVLQDELRAAMQNELDALQTDDWTVTDATYKAIAELWLWSILPTSSLVDLIQEDPVLKVQGMGPRLNETQAAAIHDLFLPAFTSPPSNFLDQVRAAVDQDEETFTELIHAAHRPWVIQPESERLYPFDDVGVLLPLRLETLFDAPGSVHNDDTSHWKLSLRVIPDEASICRDNGFVSEGEQKAMLAFWQAVRQPGDVSENWLDGEEAKIAWSQLCERVTPSRAAWLVGNVLPRLEGESLSVELPADMPTEAQPNRVGGLPPELYVFAMTDVPMDGRTRHLIGRLPMDSDKNIELEALTLPLPGHTQDEKKRWWASWDTAKSLGLAGEWHLPEGMDPNTLRVLYVLGIGDETPHEHFRAQVDAGELAILPINVATNAVHGQTSASLGREAAEWQNVARNRLLHRLDPEQAGLGMAGGKLQTHLGGSSTRLPFFPGANIRDETEDSHVMAVALWPALWGHWLHDLWQAGDDTFHVGLWSSFYFYPEGPLMPVRIGDQPYGLLPVTTLSEWVVDSPDPVQVHIQSTMASALTELLSRLARAVEPGRSIVGKSSRKFIELLAQDAVSKKYIVRNFIEAWAAGVPYNLSQDFDEHAFRTYERAMEIMQREPTARYLAVGYPWNNELPLVQPTRMLYTHLEGENRNRLPLPTFLSLLMDEQNFSAAPQDYDLENIFRRVWLVEDREAQMSTLPDSLLIRLLVHASQIAFLWRQAAPGSNPVQGPVELQQSAALSIAQWLDDPGWQGEERDPISGLPVFTLNIPDANRSWLERILCVTLDSAAHRIDPWITGFAWGRLQRHSGSNRGAHRLGAYGWVDGPFEGRPGPTDSGRLHTPSYNQTLAALILRDKFLSSSRSGTLNEVGDNPWEMNLTSARVRLADEIAEEVRMGFHIYEIVGRHVESILGTHQAVRELRTIERYAMHADRKDPHEVCNGIRALVGLLKGGDPEAKVMSQDLRPDAPANDDPAFPLTDSRRDQLKELHLALDAYGDLLIAEGALQLVNRQIDRAAEAMEAAAGFSRPPSFEFTRTPPSGYQLESVVISAVPFISVDSVRNDEGPIHIADPSVAAFLSSKLGDDWIWQAVNTDDNSVLGEVNLPELGFSPADTLALSNELLCDLSRTKLGLPLVTIREAQNRLWEVRDSQNDLLGRVTLVDLQLPPQELAALDDATIRRNVRQVLGAAENANVAEVPLEDSRLWILRDENDSKLGMGSPASLGLMSEEVDRLAEADLYRLLRQSVAVPQVEVNPPRQHELAQQLVASLGSRPAAGRDFIDTNSAQAGADVAIYAELLGRYEMLHTRGRQMVQDLRTAPDDAARVGALRRALTWGVSPVSDPADRKALLASLAEAAMPEGATPLDALAESVAKSLEERLDSFPKPSDLVSEDRIGLPLPEHLVLKKKSLPDGVSSLASAIASLAAPNARLAILACWSKNDLVQNTQLDPAQTEPALNETWLTVVAATRSNLARLEAVQLEMVSPLATWSSSPGDPWQTGIVKQNNDKREEASSLAMRMPRFVAAYGMEATWQGEKVAVGLVDAFSEAIPMRQRTTVTAFGFNAPSARAPQAILLAVPPKPQQKLDADLLLKIVAETRELAHARTARIEDLGDLQALAPSMWLQSNGPIRIRLEPWPLFD